jgi:glycerol-3-phosphate dehydrogenase (NAD(P)+)
MAACIEGVSSIEAVLALAARHHIELPICETVAAVLEGTASPHDALGSLMGRAATVELQDLEHRSD